MVSGVFFNVALPSIGVVLSTIQLAVPFATILECRKQGTIGPLDPVPWVSSWVNCFGWMVYGVVVQDIYIMLSVLFGVVLNFYAITTALTLLGAHNEFHRTREMELVGMAGIIVWLILGLLVGTGLVSEQMAQFLTGTVVLCTGILYYVSPISSGAQVLRDWDASSLSLPMLLLNAVASGVWAFYGFVIDDPFVYGLNTFAVLVSVGFVTVKLILPSNVGASKKHTDDDEGIKGVQMKDQEWASPTSAGPAPNIDSVIIGTVRNRSGTATDRSDARDQIVRIAVSSNQLNQLVRSNTQTGEPEADSSSRNRRSISAAPALASNSGSDSLFARLRSATTVKEVVHEFVDTLVPPVQFDPVNLFLDTAPMPVGDGGSGGGAITPGSPMGARLRYEPPHFASAASPTANISRLDVIEERDSSFSSASADADAAALRANTLANASASPSPQRNTTGSNSGQKKGGAMREALLPDKNSS